MADWVVAVARHQRGGDAVDELTSAGFNCYRPKFREKVLGRGRRGVWVERLLLGPYILIEFTFDWIARYAALASMRFVRGLLMADERPMLALDSEVRAMQGSEVHGYVPVSRVPLRGSLGHVRGGTFNQLSGIFQHRDEKRCVDNVLVQLFGTWSKIELPMGSWESA